MPDSRATLVPAGAVWTVAVTAGLALLLLITLYGVTSVLVQRSDSAIGGMLPVLNLPGPKLWAMPLLQRPIGNAPELPGVLGTRTAILSVLAVWLITTRPPASSDAPIGGGGSSGGGGFSGEPLRLATRWGTLVVFGASFGVLLSRQGLWPEGLPPYRVLLVCTAELPATALLYLYFRDLSARLPGRERRRAFDHLAWAVPAVVAAGGVMLVLDWLAPDETRLSATTFTLPFAAAYGTAAVCAGVAATGAVGWLAGAFALRAFPATSRALLGTRRWLRSLRAGGLASAEAQRRMRAGAIAAGLVLLPVVMVIGIDKLGWLAARRGIGGNLPFYNFPGPKLWAAAAVPELASGNYWGPIVSRASLTVLNLLAFWLITVDPSAGPQSDESRAARLLRRTVRWLPVVVVGACLGFASAMLDYDHSNRLDAITRRGEIFVAVTILAELPPTVLLYAYLAVLARRFGRPRLGRGFLVMSGLLVVLVVAGLSGIELHRVAGDTARARSSPSVFAASAAYGAIVLTAAAWAVVAILSLAGSACARSRDGRGLP